MSNKGKTVSKSKFVSKRRLRFPRKVSKGQVTSKELSIIGYVTKKGNLKDSAPVEAIAGVGLSKGSYLRSKGIKTVGDFKGSLALEGVVIHAIPVRPVKKLSQVERKKLIHNAQKLRKAADSMSKTIEYKRNPATASQNWTPKRSRQIASMKHDADHLTEIQSIMFSIADHIESDSLPESLESVDTKTEIETINLFDKFPNVVLTRSHVQDLEIYIDTKREKELIGIVKQASASEDGWLYHLSRKENNALDELLLGMEKSYKIKSLSLQKEKQEIRDKYFEKDYETYRKRDDELEKQERMLRSFRSGTFDSESKKRLARYKRLAKMGIFDDVVFQQVKRDLEGIKELEKKKTSEEIKVEQIKVLEDKVRGYKIAGFFPTPRPVANKMVNYADIESKHSVLEPSAGNGWLADVIAEREDREPSEIDVIEYNFDLREILELKGYNVVGTDFLEFHNRYDRIMMNPPFERDQDIEHVYHAFSLLKPEGRVVAIMSAGVAFRSTGKAPEFRSWVKEQGGSIEKLPEGSFKSSFIRTGVHTIIVTIDKDIGDTIPKIKQVHSISGVTEKQVIDYIPEEAVEKMGKYGWNVKTIMGNTFPTEFKTKREAIEQARRHKQLWEDTFDDPDRWVRPDQIKYVE